MTWWQWLLMFLSPSLAVALFCGFCLLFGGRPGPHSH